MIHFSDSEMEIWNGCVTCRRSQLESSRSGAHACSSGRAHDFLELFIILLDLGTYGKEMETGKEMRDIKRQERKHILCRLT